MADQLIFTSSVRGIKPGASGYCTVLRSPGIRSALEQALEKISVFEHGRCNQGRMVYTYRKLEIRDKTYLVLSRISDAGKDYTGRTNFLAHHLTFSKEELPDMSPADLLLHWPNWCQEWTGDPREEPVDPGSFSAIITTKPPVRLWKEQAAGMDGAVKLASDTGTSFILRSNSASDESLLQLIAEAFAVRTKFNQSSAYAWTTTFSVGLAVTGSAKSFKWLALRASDDYPLSGAVKVLDLDSTLAGASSANEELIAIAREGQFRPAPKPIPLTPQDSPAARSIPIQGTRTPQQPASPQKLKLGRRSPQRPSPPAGHAAKAQSKKKALFALLACALILVLSVAGFWVYQQQKKSSTNEKYEQQVEALISIHDTWKLSGQEAEIPVAQLKQIFEKMRKIDGQSDNSLDDMININWSRINSNNYPHIEKQNANNAFQELREYVLNHDKISGYAERASEKKDSEALDVKNTNNDGARLASDAASEDNLKESEQKYEERAVAEPLDLNQYGRVILRVPGETVPLKSKDFFNLEGGDKVKVAKLDRDKNALFSRDLVLSDSWKSLIEPDKPIPANSHFSAIQASYEKKEADLIVIASASSNQSVKIGYFSLPDLPLGRAMDQVESKFLVDELVISLEDVSGPVRQPAKPTSPDPSKNSFFAVDKGLFETMAIDSGNADISIKTIENFEKWAVSQIKSDLEKLTEAQGDSESESVKLIIASYKKVIKNNDSISSYFTAYEKELDSILVLKEANENDDAKEKLYDTVFSALTNSGYGKRFEIKSESNSTYALDWDGTEWGVSVVNAKKYIDIKRRSAKELREDLGRFLDLLLNESEWTKYNDDLDEYDEKPREWRSIVFKRPVPDGGVIATVEVK